MPGRSHSERIRPRYTPQPTRVLVSPFVRHPAPPPPLGCQWISGCVHSDQPFIRLPAGPKRASSDARAGAHCAGVCRGAAGPGETLHAPMGEARRRASCSAETTTAAGNKGTTHWQRGIRRLGPAEPRSPRGSSRAPALAQPLLSKGGSTAFEARANAPPPGPEVAARLRTGIPLPFWAPRGPIRCRVTWAEPAFVHRESSQEIRQEPKSAQFPAVRSLGGARRLSAAKPSRRLHPMGTKAQKETTRQEGKEE